MGAGRKKKDVELAAKAAYRQTCEEIIEEARKITETGHVVVLTSPEDKKPLSIAYAVKDAVLRQLDEPTVEPPRTSSGVRFSAL